MFRSQAALMILCLSLGALPPGRSTAQENAHAISLLTDASPGDVETRRAEETVKTSFPGSVLTPTRSQFEGEGTTSAIGEIFVSPGAPRDLKAGIFLQDKDGTWFEAAISLNQERNAWQPFEVDLSPKGGSVTPVGHGAVWNSYYARHVTRAGLFFSSQATWQGELKVRSLRFLEEPPAKEIRLAGFRVLTEHPKAFSLYELAFELPGVSGNPFDPDSVTVDAVFRSPSGRESQLPGFYYQPFRRELDPAETEVVTPVGRGSWRIRYTPVEAGEHTWQITVKTASGETTTREHEFLVNGAPARGFIRVSKKDRRYFETVDGKFFYPIGQNIHSPIDRRCAQMLKVAPRPNKGTFAYDHYLAETSENGQNCMIVWMCNWWVSIEWNAAWKGFGGLTDYHLGNAWRLDYLMNKALERGIHIILVLDNHGRFSDRNDREWKTNPYNSVQGGPCLWAEDFFRDRKPFEIYKKRLRYIVARWASYPNLMAYQLVSEIDLTGTDRSFKRHPIKAVWCGKASRAIKEMDPYEHPVTVQYCGDYTHIDPRVASLADLDFILGNAYQGRNDTVSLMLKTATQNARFKKPSFSAEFGGSWRGGEIALLHANLHAGLWSNCMSESSATPFIWWTDYVDRYNRFFEFKGLARYMAGEDRRGLELKQHEGAVTSGGLPAPGLACRVFGGSDRADFWVYDTAAAESMPKRSQAATHTDTTVTVPGLSPGRYRVEIWDTLQGRILKTQEGKATKEGLTVDLPRFRIDIAGKIRPSKEGRE